MGKVDAVVMKLKPDWAEARERLTSWWSGERTDRVVALVTSPRAGVTRMPLREETPGKYTDAETVFHNLDARLSATCFGGEAIPAHWVYLGPIPLGGYMGCGLHFERDTVWQSPCRDTWERPEDLAFDPANRWYRLLRRLTEDSVRRADGAYMVSGQGFGCVFDVIASMWGSEKTLMAMAERPETIRTITRKLVDISRGLFDEVDSLVSPYQEGAFDWLQLWAPGRIWTLQSDLCCMVSPRMFEELILEELREEAEYVDFAFYHLDGPGAIRHLDALLGIEALDGIQWVPGSGASQDPMDWINLFRRIQEAGKKVLIYCPPDRVRPLLHRISKRNVCLGISCSDQTAAERVLAELDDIGT